MIIAVTQFYHDYRPTSDFVDTSKLNPENPIDKMVIDAVAQPLGEDDDNTYNVTYQAHDWEGVPFWKQHGEPFFANKDAYVKGVVAEAFLHLHIVFE
jgi:hypothetical protein